MKYWCPICERYHELNEIEYLNKLGHYVFIEIENWMKGRKYLNGRRVR